uniref:Uncharacterized protein n=1 Tax=Myoviridae sp. ctu2j3 TaxID=2825197 RepID=A0A8S5UIX1_9CAUD|nr:MAG TPA: hypothetical protein [Myoviridae sp. ctu2j3]DAF94379.1 MAG TPA: hypothetical protein [Myoviridae sp. ctu2j3]
MPVSKYSMAFTRGSFHGLGCDVGENMVLLRCDRCHEHTMTLVGVQLLDSGTHRITLFREHVVNDKYPIRLLKQRERSGLDTRHAVFSKLFGRAVQHVALRRALLRRAPQLILPPRVLPLAMHSTRGHDADRTLLITGVVLFECSYHLSKPVDPVVRKIEFHQRITLIDTSRGYTNSVRLQLVCAPLIMRTARTRPSSGSSSSITMNKSKPLGSS